MKFNGWVLVSSLSQSGIHFPYIKVTGEGELDPSGDEGGPNMGSFGEIFSPKERSFSEKTKTRTNK